MFGTAPSSNCLCSQAVLFLLFRSFGPLAPSVQWTIPPDWETVGSPAQAAEVRPRPRLRRWGSAERRTARSVSRSAMTRVSWRKIYRFSATTMAKYGFLESGNIAKIRAFPFRSPTPSTVHHQNQLTGSPHSFSSLCLKLAVVSQSQPCGLAFSFSLDRVVFLLR